MKEEDKAIREFFIWMVKEANIEVVGEDAIEVYSMKDKNGLIPVMTIDELIKLFRSRTKAK